MACLCVLFLFFQTKYPWLLWCYVTSLHVFKRQTALQGSQKCCLHLEMFLRCHSLLTVTLHLFKKITLTAPCQICFYKVRTLHIIGIAILTLPTSGRSPKIIINIFLTLFSSGLIKTTNLIPTCGRTIGLDTSIQIISWNYFFNRQSSLRNQLNILLLNLFKITFTFLRLAELKGINIMLSKRTFSLWVRILTLSDYNCILSPGCFLLFWSSWLRTDLHV